MKRIFVAGATGALGRRAVPLLVEAGHQVTGVGRTSAKRAQLERQGARPVDVDLFDKDAVRRVIQGSDVIVNLATAVPPGFRGVLPWSWRQMDRIRTEVSANLVGAALAAGTVERIVQESFAPIYADGGERWIHESSPIRPARYNRTARVAESNIERFTAAGRTGAVLRFGMLYGPGDPMTLQMIDAVRKGWFPIFGRPDGYTSWVTHEDAGGSVVAALGVPAGIYNVVDDEPLRRRELADGIAQLVGVRPPRLLPSWATLLGGVIGETIARSLRISNRKLRRSSTWSPRVPSPLDGIAAVMEDEPVGFTAAASR